MMELKDMTFGDYVTNISMTRWPVRKHELKAKAEQVCAPSAWIMTGRGTVFGATVSANGVVINHIPDRLVNVDSRRSSPNYMLYGWFYERYNSGSVTDTEFFDTETGTLVAAKGIIVSALKACNGNSPTAVDETLVNHMRTRYKDMDWYGHIYGNTPPSWVWRDDVDLFNQFGGAILGIAKKDVVVGDNDITIYVSLRRGPYDKQVEFVKKRRDEIVEYILNAVAKGETRKMKKVASLLGNLEFYYPSSITVTRSSQIEFIFSPKPGIEKILGS